MSNLSQFEQISNQEDNIPLGAVVKIYVSSTTGPSVDPDNSNHIRTGQSYLQADYPELYSTIGLVEAGAWTPVAGLTRTIQSLTFGNGVFISAQNETGFVRTSTDGTTWTQRSTGLGQLIKTTKFLNNNFINGSFGINTPGAGISTSTNGISWSNYSGLGGPSSFNDIAYGAGKYVAVGDVGLLVTSTDGALWEIQNLSRTSSAIRTVAYGNGIYVYGTEQGRIGTSTDFNTWTVTASAVTTSTIRKIIYGNGLFVALADSTSSVFTSTDAATWTARTSENSLSLSDIVYNNGQYIAVGLSGVAITSTDAVSWSVRNRSGTTSVLSGIVYGDGLYVIGGQGGVLKSSTDTVSWTNRTSGTTSSIRAITYGNSIYMYGGDGGALATSTDAVTWTARNFGTTSAIFSLEYGNNLFVAAGSNFIRTSTDGVAWTNRVSGTYNKVIYRNSLYVAAGPSGVLLTSTDAITWNSRTSGTTSNINSVAFGNGLYLLSTANGGISTSTDTIVWSQRASRTTDDILAIDYDATDNIYWYMTNIGGIGTSTDGITWSSGGRDTGITYQDIAWSGSLYVVVGNTGVIRTSTNGFIWTNRVSGTTSNLNAIAYSSDINLFAAVGTTGTIRTSTDGITWSNNNSGSSSFNDIVAGLNIFVAVGNTGTIRTSTDGVTWTAQSSGTTANLNAIAWTGTEGQYITVGSGGAIYVSFDAITWTDRSLTGTGLPTFTGVAYSPTLNRYIAITSSVTYYRSTDSITWTGPFDPTNLSSNNYTGLNDVVWNGTRFLIVGPRKDFSPSLALVSSSPDGINWDSNSGSGASGQFSTSILDLNSIAWLDNQFIAVGSFGAILTSRDGADWALKTSIYDRYPIFSTVNMISQTGSYILIGSLGSISTSTDLTTWTNPGFETETSRSLARIIYDGSQYVAAGVMGTVRSTTDLVTWNQFSVGRPDNISVLGYGEGTYVYATGFSSFRNWGYTSDLNLWTLIDGNNQGSMLGSFSSSIIVNDLSYDSGLWTAAGTQNYATSTDGITWTIRRSLANSSDQFYFSEKVNDRYVISAERGVLASSTNGTTDFTNLYYTTNTTATVSAITYGNDQFVLSTQNNTIHTSTDGITWVQASSGINAQSLLFNNGLYVSAGTFVRSSTDAVTWTTRTTLSSLQDIKYFEGKYIVAGQSGVLFTSTDLDTWNRSFSITTRNIQGVTYGNGVYVYGQLSFFGNTSPTLFTSADPSVLVYSLLYNISTEFYIPQISAYTSVPGIQNVYIKGK